MIEYPNDRAGDVACWGLKPVQAARYCARLSRMHAEHATRSAARSRFYARRARRLSALGTGLAVLALVLSIAAMVGHA